MKRKRLSSIEALLAICPALKRRSIGLAITSFLVVAIGVLDPVLAQTGAVGAVRGSIYDIDYEAPLGGVRVSIVEALLTTVSDTAGNFVFDSVPPGSYTLTFSRDGYVRETRRDVVVTAGRLNDLGRVEMGTIVVDMPEMVVTGGDLLANSEFALLEIRAADVTFTDAISAETFSKAGVGDVAGAVRLVTGVSVVDGKYATVRGLSDRYTGTTLNGIRVPSADPRRRAVQIDQFPTGTVDNITVSKTFTPDLQGDFTGGGIDIQTKAVPEGPLFQVSFGIEHNSLATNNNHYLTYVGGGTEPFDNKGRDLPAEALERLPTQPPASAFPPPQAIEDAEAYDRYTRAFTPVIGTTTTTPEQNTGLSILAGNKYRIGKEMVIGVVGAATYSHKFDFYGSAENNTGVVTGRDAPIDILAPREDNRGTEQMLIGGLGTVVIQPNDRHEIAIRAIVNESAEDQARIQIENTGAQSIEQNQALTYTERSVSSLQGSFHHILSDSGATLDWAIARNETEQDEPDVRFFRNTFDLASLSARMPSNSTDAQNTRRTWRNVSEENRQYRADLRLPFQTGRGVEGAVKFGFFSERIDRDFTQNSFTYTFPFQFGNLFFNPAVAANFFKSQFLAQTAEDLWTDVFLQRNRIGLALNRCKPPDNVFANPCSAPNQLLWTVVPIGKDVNYIGDGANEGYYAMAEIPVGQRVRVTGGARIEKTEMFLDPTNVLFGTIETIQVLPSGDRAIVTVPDEEGRANISDQQWLPAISVAWDFAPAMKLRASWARTIARPTFRELAPLATEEFLFGDEFFGNPDLVLSDIKNYDLRYEWFRRPGELIAASVFYKEIENPIELISFATGNRSFIQPVNFPVGEVRGFEIEGRTALDFFGDHGSRWGLGANFTYLDTEVLVPDAERMSLESFGLDEVTRRLQGQPEFLLNANLTYDDPDRGWSGGLFYNLVGETLLTGAARGVEDGNPNVFEQQRGVLNLTLTKDFGEHLSLRFRGQNLLREDFGTIYRIPDGSEATKIRRETPMRLGLGLSYRW